MQVVSDNNHLPAKRCIHLSRPSILLGESTLVGEQSIGDASDHSTIQELILVVSSELLFRSHKEKVANMYLEPAANEAYAAFLGKERNDDLLLGCRSVVASLRSG
jgi:hypothetical protein